MYNNDDLIKEKYLKNRIISWGQKNYYNFPWRSTENSWHALCAEIMLQRTNADQVVPVYTSFCIKYPTPDDFKKKSRSNPFKSKLGTKDI